MTSYLILPQLCQNAEGEFSFLVYSEVKGHGQLQSSSPGAVSDSSRGQVSGVDADRNETLIQSLVIGQRQCFVPPVPLTQPKLDVRDTTDN